MPSSDPAILLRHLYHTSRSVDDRSHGNSPGYSPPPANIVCFVAVSYSHCIAYILAYIKNSKV